MMIAIARDKQVGQVIFAVPGLGRMDDPPPQELSLNVSNIPKTLDIPEQLPTVFDLVVTLHDILQTLPIDPRQGRFGKKQKLLQLIPGPGEIPILSCLNEHMPEHIKSKEQRKVVKNIAKGEGNSRVEGKHGDGKMPDAVAHLNHTLPFCLKA